MVSCAFCWLALRLLRWSEVLTVHFNERVFPVSLCPGRSSQPSQAISRVRAVSPSLGGATASSHLRNSFILSHSGVPQCDVCPCYCSFIPNPQTFPQVARWYPWSVGVFAMRSSFSGRGCFSQHSIVMKTLLTLFYLASESSRWGHPSRVEVAILWLLTRSEWSLWLNQVTRSFGMRSPFGSCVVLGPHLISNEGFPCYLVWASSGWSHPFRVKLSPTWSRLKFQLSSKWQCCCFSQPHCYGSSGFIFPTTRQGFVRLCG